MITTPTSTASTSASTPAMPQVPKEFLMMAAAQMHSEGRLVIPVDSTLPHDRPDFQDGDMMVSGKLGRKDMKVRGPSLYGTPDAWVPPPWSDAVSGTDI